ncbi:MAG: hypothetical protein EBX55_09565 [Betaproteobacteria bacterium]|nr:hypothetical protein [Betaproteobacteria bacterium]
MALNAAIAKPEREESLQLLRVVEHRAISHVLFERAPNQLARRSKRLRGLHKPAQRSGLFQRLSSPPQPRR